MSVSMPGAREDNCNFEILQHNEEDAQRRGLQDTVRSL